ncbi:FkbM family methyltransferase [Rhizobium sp. XQZ8]|uniref:FkbM family methyltransferase n=1 Tax=Rhizobium populisoli TaxID=2859785 RepID=UPI001C671183|nr:FkbM family methyltransferase [Rhizobium populisoli]MBW6420129.1 FkbM family methyltransferase [Rhizobium populisoli]
MLNYSNPILINVRSALSALGILRPAVRFYRKISGKAYEDKFDTALMGEIRPGDIVWDIGANVGYYTEKFADAVGSTGTVIAFEPSPRSAENLRSRFSETLNVTIESKALSDREGIMDFFVSENSVVDSLFQRADLSDTKIEKVEVRRADGLTNILVPNVVKIDVEGYEVEVILGMEKMLRASNLRALFVEVHFTELRERGLSNGSEQIVNMLKQNGFKCTWTDPSHIAASKG